MTEKYWDKLLTKWRAQKRDGFTIPYIIGSQKYLPDNQQIQDIEELLIDIVNNDQTEIYISYCDTIGDIILGVRDETKKELLGSYPSFKGKSQSKFYLTTGVNHLGKNMENIISSLKDKFQADINDGKFSLNNGIKGDYSPKEIEFITTCYSE